MAPVIDFKYIWFSKLNPLENSKESVQRARCTCSFCADANDRATDEAIYETSHPLDYFIERGMTLKQGTRISNSHILDALSILHESYRKVLQPVRLESLCGATVKKCVGFQGLEALSKLIPEPIYNSLFDYTSDALHMFGNYAKLHDDIPEHDQIDSLPTLQKHVKKYLVTEYPYLYFL